LIEPLTEYPSELLNVMLSMFALAVVSYTDICGSVVQVPAFPISRSKFVIVILAGVVHLPATKEEVILPGP
jgi:hypothetical protein